MMRFLKCKKGMGAIVGLVMSLLIIILFTGGTFLWQVNQENMMNALDKDWFDESYLVEATYGSDITIQVINNGAIDVKLIRIWIIDNDNNDHQSINVDYDIPAGATTSIDQAEINELTDKLSNPLDMDTITYYFKIVTERGNMVTSILAPRDPVIISDYLESGPYIDIGYLRFFFELKSLNFTSTNHHDPAPGWVVPGDENLMFHVKIVNISEDPIQLKKQCCFYLMKYYETAGSSQGAWSFYIVSPTSTHPGNMYPYNEENNPYVLYPNAEENYHLGGPPVVVKFGSLKMSGNEGLKLPSDPEVTYLDFMGFFYEVGGIDYGQTIPYVSIRSIKPYP